MDGGVEESGGRGDGGGTDRVCGAIFSGGRSWKITESDSAHTVGASVMSIQRFDLTAVSIACMGGSFMISSSTREMISAFKRPFELFNTGILDGLLRSTCRESKSTPPLLHIPPTLLYSSRIPETHSLAVPPASRFVTLYFPITKATPTPRKSKCHSTPYGKYVITLRTLPLLPHHRAIIATPASREPISNTPRSPHQWRKPPAPTLPQPSSSAHLQTSLNHVNRISLTSSNATSHPPVR